MIGIVIVSYGDPGRTVRFVREECSKVAAEHRVVVVDNGGAEASTQTLKDALGDAATVLPAGGNIGFARANNLGAGYAIRELGADLLLFVNNDIVFTDSDVVDRLAAKLQALPDAGMIGPKVVGLDGCLQSPEPFKSFAEQHLLPYWGKLVMSRSKLDLRLKRGYAETAAEGPHYRLMGSIFMMRAADFEACDGMDPATFLFAEEAILSERLKRMGKCVWYDPSVQVLHEHGATIGKHFSRVKRRRMRLESDAYYYRNYIGLPGWQYAAARVTYFLKAVFGL